MSEYRRDTYSLYRYELVAPDVRNDGVPSDYTDAIRKALAANGFTGWTEVPTVGYWHGKLEHGTTFTLYAPEKLPGSTFLVTELLSRMARVTMPDQEAIQIVKFPVPINLIEA